MSQQILTEDQIQQVKADLELLTEVRFEVTEQKFRGVPESTLTLGIAAGQEGVDKTALNNLSHQGVIRMLPADETLNYVCVDNLRKLAQQAARAEKG